MRGASLLGSIPAGAGEPPPRRGSRRAGRVHPRGCGGAVAAEWTRSAIMGPSPRVRGSLCPECNGEGVQGSIPAGAGEPP